MRPSIPKSLTQQFAVAAFPAAIAAIAALWCANATAVAANLPLESSRSARFTTTEGTWMSVDVSPDGRTLYFDHLGDIYRLPIEGGTAQRLVGGMDWSVQPRVSPDGNTVVFVSDRSGSMNLWFYDLNGGALTQFTRERHGEQIFFADPEWTSDGASVLVWTTRRRNWFYGNLPREIRQYDVEGRGTTFRALTGSGSQSISGAESPSLSPDGRFLYYGRFIETRSPFYGDRILPEWQVEGRDLFTGQTFALSNRHGGGFAPHLTPDGKRIIYGSRDRGDTGLRLLDLETGEDRWLLFPVDRDQQESNFFYNLPGMGFTPDGDSLVAGFGGGLNRVDLATGAVTKIPFVVDVALELGPLVRPQRRLPENIETPRRIRAPQLSPDGKTYAFVVHDRVWLMDADGGAPRRLDGREMQQADPVWTPDGQSVVYTSFLDDEGGHVWMANARRGEEVSRLTKVAGNYFAPVVSPDGARVYVTRVSGGHPEAITPPFDLLELTLAASEVRRIGSAPLARLQFPARVHVHGEDASRLYVSLRNVLTEIAHGHGAAPQELARVFAAARPFTGRGASLNTLPADSVTPSPDGSHYLAAIGGQVYVAKHEGRAEADLETLSAAVLNGDDAALRLSKAGGEFPSWSADGETVIYSLGNKIFRHDRNASGQFEATPSDIIAVTVALRTHVPEGVFAVKNVKIVTMNGDQVIGNGVVVVRNDRIAAVGRRGAVRIPKDAHVIDGKGGVLMPGLVDTHAHLPTGVGYLHIGARAQQPWPLLNYLSYGVTTVHDPAQRIGDLEYGDLVRAGRIIGPRIFGSGPHVAWQRARFYSYDDAKDLLARYGDNWRTLSLKEYVAGDRRARQWVAMAAREQGQVLPVFEGEDFNYNLTHVIDGYGDMSHSIGVAPLYDDVVQLMALAGTSVSYQFGTLRGEGAPSAMYYFMNLDDPFTNEKARRFMPAERLARRLSRRLEIHPTEHAFPLMARQAASLMRAGVVVSLGDHGEWGGLGVHWDVWAAAFGMSNREALAMATVGGIKTLGLEKDLGIVEVGKLADFLVIDGDPLKDIRDTVNLRYVVKNGEVYDAASLDRVFPAPQHLRYAPWWPAREPTLREGGERAGGAPPYGDRNRRSDRYQR